MCRADSGVPSTPQTPSTEERNAGLGADDETSQSRARRAAGDIVKGRARLPGIDFEAEAANAVFDLLDVESTGMVRAGYHLRPAPRGVGP